MIHWIESISKQRMLVIQANLISQWITRLNHLLLCWRYQIRIVVSFGLSLIVSIQWIRFNDDVIWYEVSISPIIWIKTLELMENRHNFHSNKMHQLGFYSGWKNHRLYSVLWELSSLFFKICNRFSIFTLLNSWGFLRNFISGIGPNNLFDSTPMSFII